MADLLTRKEREDFLLAHSQDEVAAIKKDVATVTSDRYKTPKTSPLIFHFDPFSYRSSTLRFKDCTITHQSVDGNDIYIFDHFFLPNEGKSLQEASSKGSFSRQIFGGYASKEKGEEPAHAMDNKEKWLFFSNPPQEVKEIYKFLGWLAHRMNADITTLPWELYDQEICSPAFATNRIEKLSHESMELGKHDDYDTENGIAFGIPVLYSQDKVLHPNRFKNGEEGKPWLVSLMLYATSEDFLPEYGLGTAFWKNNGEIASKAECRHMRFVLFEGNIIHGIEESRIPGDKNPWRISYVFKLSINPRQEHESMKKTFAELVTTHE